MSAKEQQEQEMETLSEEINRLIAKGEVERALILIESLISLAKKVDSNYYLGKGYSDKGIIYYGLNNVIKAIENLEISLNIFKMNINYFFEEVIKTSNSLGVLYKNIGEPKRAFEVLFYSIFLSEKHNVINSTVYNNIAWIYVSQSNFIKGLEYYKIAIKIEEKANPINIKKKINYLSNIASLYIRIGENDKAEEIYKKTYYYCKTNNELVLLILTLKGLGKLLHDKNNFIDSELYLKKAIEISFEIQFKIHLVDLFLFLSKVYFKTNRAELQLDSILKAQVIAVESYPTREILVLDELYKYYFENKQIQEAHNTLLRIHTLFKENAQKEKDEKLLELQEQFEAQQKDKLILQEQKFNKSLQESNQKLTKALAKQQALELHIKSLQLQLSPHFIFNTLQSIQGYIFNKSPFETSDYLAEFAVLMRSVLKASRELAIPLQLELSLLKNYVSLEQRRFMHSFQYHEWVSEDINQENTLIPSFLIQPFIENAILHGISKKMDGAIYLVIRKKKKGYYIHIIDNGMGREAAAMLEKKTYQGKSMALDILTERCSLSKDSPSFSYEYKICNRFSNPKNSGTHVVLSVENKKMKA